MPVKGLAAASAYRSEGIGDGAERQPSVAQYYYGEERYALALDWPHPAVRAKRWYLRGDRCARSIRHARAISTAR